MKQIYDRWKTIPVDQVLPLLTGEVTKGERAEIEGVKTHVSGLRLTTFKTKGLTCVACGIQGRFFALERSFRADVPPISPEAISPYHLNLYGQKIIDGIMRDVLMTHDHILARSLGGADTLENTQTMCAPCNSVKGSSEGTLYLSLLHHEDPVVKKAARQARDARLLEQAGMRKQAKEEYFQKIGVIPPPEKIYRSKEEIKARNAARNQKRKLRKKAMLARRLAAKLAVVQSTD